MSFKEYWGGQFAYPHGFGGKISTIIMNRINRKMNAAILNNVPCEGDILDIGFGGGNTLKLLLKNTNAIMHGIDISCDMIKLASKRNKKYLKNGRLFLNEGAADNITFDKKFDAIYTSNTVYFWSDLNNSLSEIKQKLTTNGKFINVFRTKEWLDKLDYTKNYNKYTLEELTTATKTAGFKTETIQISDETYLLKATL